eukprot:scaffold234027_cov22-Prasinocladus_malaysianus.AAC.1
MSSIKQDQNEKYHLLLVFHELNSLVPLGLKLSSLAGPHILRLPVQRAGRRASLSHRQYHVKVRDVLFTRCRCHS